MTYSRRQLEAFGEPLGESATRVKPGGQGRIYGGGGGGPTSSTVVQSNLPEWARPQVEGMLSGATRQLFTTELNPETGKYDITGTRPYTPYSVDPSAYVAGFSPLQQQVQQNVANLQMPGQFQMGTDLATQAGLGAMQSAQQAQGYGQAGFQTGRTGADIGLMGLQAQDYGQLIGNQARQYAGQAANIGDWYGRQMTEPVGFDAYGAPIYGYQQYMSPYQRDVTDLQVQAAQRQADIARVQRGSQAARAGAFGGARQAIENAEANRALQSQIANIEAQGLQTAYDKAQAAIAQQAQLGLQGLQGAQQGLGTALQGGQLGLSGIGQALAGQQLGLQGAQAGLQGVSGAQAGYGLGNQIANTLGSLGTQQLAGQTGILGLQNQIGAQQQAQQQQIINQAIQNYANAQQAPMQAFNEYNALLRGYAIPGQTTTSYQAQPSIAAQIGGLGTAGIAGLGMYNAMNK